MMKRKRLCRNLVASSSSDVAALMTPAKRQKINVDAFSDFLLICSLLECEFNCSLVRLDI